MSKIISKRLLPPYSKELLNKLQSGNKPKNDVYLFLGTNAWQYAKSHFQNGKSVLLLPENTTPEKFIWPVSELSVLIFDLRHKNSDEVLIQQLALELLVAGAEIVRCVCYANQSPLVVFYRDGTRQVKSEGSL